MSTLKVNTLLAADANPATPVAIPGLDKRFATAWVNFNGTGTVAIRSAYNVASITDNGVGLYAANLTSPLANTNYCVSVNTGQDASSYGVAGVGLTGATVAAIPVDVRTTGGAATDRAVVNVIIFGGRA